MRRRRGCGRFGPAPPQPWTPPAPPWQLAELTPRELEVLQQLARGRSNAEIAVEFALSVATVKTHVKRVPAKLGVRDRAQAVIVAYETGLITPGCAARR